MIERREETGVSLTDQMCGDFRRSVRFRVSQPHREKNLRLIHAISRTQLLYRWKMIYSARRHNETYPREKYSFEIDTRPELIV